MPGKVRLYGYFGHGNLGDEALRETWIATLAPEFRVRTCSPPRPPVARGPWLFCGGLLQDRTSIRSLAFYAAAIRFASGRGPVGLAGIGVELHRGAARGLVKAALAGVGYLSVRDAPSQEALATLGFEARLFPDPVLSWAPPPRRGEGGLLLNLVPTLPSGLRARAVAEALSLGEALGTRVKGLAMSPADVPALKGLPVLRPATPAQALELVAAASLVIAARLHALELALVAGTPFVALPYAGKVEAFLQLVERELLAPVPRAPGGAEDLLGGDWRRGLLRARDRLREEAREGIEDVRRWLRALA